MTDRLDNISRLRRKIRRLEALNSQSDFVQDLLAHLRYDLELELADQRAGR